MKSLAQKKYSDIKDIWLHRGLIKDFVKKDFLTRYAGSMLGSVWNIINPLVMIAIYTLVFSKIMKARLPHFLEGTEAANYSYSVYLCTGLIPWGMFAESFLRSSNILLENGNLIKKVSFPSELLNISAVITSTINFLIAFSFFILFLWGINIFVGYPVKITFLHCILLGFFIFLQQIFAFGLGLIFSVLTVFFRDVGQALHIITQLWFWFTPIVYQESIIPKAFLNLLKYNPLYHFIDCYHKILFEYKYPELKTFFIALIITFTSLIIGIFVYRSLKSEIADEL